jgi:hypothetical protein
MFLWIEASMTVVYVENISPHKTLRNMTHEEDFTKMKYEVRHLRYLGVHYTFMYPRKK